jgi:hypothetical protein
MGKASSLDKVIGKCWVASKRKLYSSNILISGLLGKPLRAMI